MTGLPSINLTNARGVMAQHRDRRVPATVWVGLGGIILTALLLGAIQIGGEATQLRQEIQALGRGCDELEARQAVLSLQWNSESSRHVIMERAQRELELVCPEEPGLLLVMASEAESAGRRDQLALDLSACTVPAAMAGERP